MLVVVSGLAELELYKGAFIIQNPERPGVMVREFENTWEIYLTIPSVCISIGLLRVAEAYSIPTESF